MGILESVSGFVSKLGGKGAPKAGAPAPDRAALLAKIQQSELFKNLPADRLEDIFNRMETISAAAGEVIIREGAEGDYYYLLMTGTAQVKRLMPGKAQPELVAEIGEPFGFGEEALISNAKRNATVMMKTKGSLMRISKDEFCEYIKDVLVSWLSPMEAQDKVAKGAKWVDVRDLGATKESQLHGALSLPLDHIRDYLDAVDKATFYVCYCDNGRASATAAFLMRQRGFNVAVLRGGLNSLKRAGLSK